MIGLLACYACQDTWERELTDSEVHAHLVAHPELVEKLRAGEIDEVELGEVLCDGCEDFFNDGAEEWDISTIKRINYSDYTTQEEIKELCSKERVIFDFNFWDIPNTMRRNVKALAELGGYGVTVANHPLNDEGIAEAQKVGAEYGILIILGERGDIDIGDQEKVVKR